MSATRECACVCMYMRAGGAVADVRVPMFLVEDVYYMTPLDIVFYLFIR